MPADTPSGGSGASPTPPQPATRKERETTAEKLNAAEAELKRKTNEVEDFTRTRAAVEKAIEGLQKAYDTAVKENEDLAKLLEKRKTEAKDDSEKKAATALEARLAVAKDAQQKMKEALDKLKEASKQAKEDAEKGTTDVNRLRRSVQDTLKAYFVKADPKMIAERYGLPLDGNFSFDVETEFMRLTKGKDRDPLRFGMGAEHTWNDDFHIGGGFGFGRTISMKSISQHEMVTTRIVHDTAEELLRRSGVKGLTVPVARVGLNINAVDLEKKPEAYKGIFGHPVESFRPTVVNNSTSSTRGVDKKEAYRELMDLYTRGEGLKTVVADNGTITYGLPPIAMPIIANASSNRGWNSTPDPTFIKNFQPHHMNIGSAEIPEVWKTNRRDEKAPPHIENYSTQNATVHAVIRRPRWNDDGTPVRTQYLNPDYEKIVEENLWRLTGKPGIPSEKELDDEASFPAPMVKALRDDKKALLEAIMRSEGSDAAGLNSNLQGTSFAAPTAGGVMLAASILYPNASKEEIMDAFCSSCVPITHRQMPHDFWEKAPTETRDDVTYLADAKTGYLYSPMAGFGEFLLDKKATQEKPDSWLKMVARLEAMEKERLRITGNGKRKTTVEVGEGTFKRTVELNGQPTPVTLELTKGTAQITDDMKKRAQATQDRVMEAFRDVDRYNDSSIIIPDDSPIAKLITERKYQEALDLLKKDYAGEGKMLAYGDVYLKAAETAVENALKEREQAYSFTVKPDQDACCTLASLRLKFKTTQDEYVVLEAPDGTRIPMLLSSRTDNVAVTSTPGVMRKSAAGTWKVYSRSELDMDNTSLVISGTERNKDLGIIDVRETVLPAFELREVKDRTPPGKNIMPPIADPHAALRLLHNPPPEPEKKGKTKVSPSTRQEFQLNLEEFIEKSNLRKGGYIPEGKIEKTSRRNDAPFMEQLTGRLADALADARLVLGSGESMARLPTTAKPQKQQTTGMARPAAKLAI